MRSPSPDSEDYRPSRKRNTIVVEPSKKSCVMSSCFTTSFLLTRVRQPVSREDDRLKRKARSSSAESQDRWPAKRTVAFADEDRQVYSISLLFSLMTSFAAMPNTVFVRFLLLHVLLAVKNCPTADLSLKTLVHLFFAVYERI